MLRRDSAPFSGTGRGWPHEFDQLAGPNRGKCGIEGGQEGHQLTQATAAGLEHDNAKWQRPNILLILADDLADWMLGCYGNKEIRTPNIDLLARSGMRFQNSFVCTPIC